ncbi:E3 ubiquitin-protein ligase [Quillaja saponaria]|uniref:E3 ubiquitin-protein ligase n=1 Tax=Quillaja saponaria TaxID=32244 RepID=A0AAD7VLP8_QUISA|nr:E3 ubiquitin-protein ligase [Quillaja saponaria]
MVKEMEGLSEEERRALRGSKFAPLVSTSRPSQSRSRLAHPGGPLTTNKAAALAKFLERKLKEPDGLASINPDLLELAVNSAKQTVIASTSNAERSIRHVDSFGDTENEDCFDDGKEENYELKGQKKKKKSKNKKKRKKNKKQKIVEDP